MEKRLLLLLLMIQKRRADVGHRLMTCSTRLRTPFARTMGQRNQKMGTSTMTIQLLSLVESKQS
jgi:hypothetical protein